mmetsp:Transcript_97125/g.192462  ORF Transcript_97125/g.192462 Transcript_97125/m.192462 type:complete len:434 (-) Transcript_97125:174-1475(-)
MLLSDSSNSSVACSSSGSSSSSSSNSNISLHAHCHAEINGPCCLWHQQCHCEPRCHQMGYCRQASRHWENFGQEMHSEITPSHQPWHPSDGGTQEYMMFQVPRSGHEHNEVHVEGPYFSKFLLSNVCAGAILGKNGSTCKKIGQRSAAQIRISHPGQLFPGTRDRICIVGGDKESLGKCMELLLKHMFDVFSHGFEKSLMIQLVVPNSAISRIIGTGGRYVSQLRAATGCCINASVRVPAMLERLVLLSGPYDSVVQSVMEVLRIIQSDPNLSEHMRFSYDGVDLPLGSWLSPRARTPDGAMSLIPPSLIQRYTKRELLEYLHANACRETMIRHGLCGSMKNLLKRRGMGAVFAAVMETWQLRCNDRPEHFLSAEAEGDSIYANGSKPSTTTFTCAEGVLPAIAAEDAGVIALQTTATQCGDTLLLKQKREWK